MVNSNFLLFGYLDLCVDSLEVDDALGNKVSFVFVVTQPVLREVHVSPLPTFEKASALISLGTR